MVSVRILGVTGGTGSGKSLVCQILKAGSKIIDADEITESFEEGKRCVQQMVRFFGDDIVKADGELDRKKIAELVFKDKEMLLKLNHIVHKHVAAEIKKRVAALKEQGSGLVVLDVPIPVEEGFFDTAECIWTVVANADLRVERIMKRMNISEEQALTRINAQLSNKEYEEIADVIIENEGSYEELEDLVLFELKRFLARLC